MSVAAFGWEDGKLILLMNRSNWESDSRNIKPAAWDADDQILGGWFEDKDNNVGTWCGCSKNGRVSFLVETASTHFKTSSVLTGSDILPVEFLRSTLSPKQFANYVAEVEEDRKDNGKQGLVYDLIVADLESKSTIHIGKDFPNDPHVEITEVANGVHSLSTDYGLDSDDASDLRLRDLLIEMIGELRNKQLPPINEIPAKFMYDPEVCFEFYADVFPGETDNDGMDLYGTTSTIAILAAKITREVIFYERYLENGVWKDHNFIFNSK